MLAPVTIITSVFQPVEWKKITLLKGLLSLPNGELRGAGLPSAHCCILALEHDADSSTQ